VTITSPQYPQWAGFAFCEVLIGLDPHYEQSGNETNLWDSGVWDSDVWGSYFDATWYSLTSQVVSVSIDSGRQNLFDPGTSARASVSLFDPEGLWGLGGSNTALGAMIWIRGGPAGGDGAGFFFGKVTDARGDESLSTPYVTLRADDPLGFALGPDDVLQLPAQSVSARLGAILDRVSWPAEMRDIQTDPTALAPLTFTGSRLDAARGAVWDSGGTLYANGDGVITYRDRSLSQVQPWPPKYEIGTDPGMVAPGELALDEKQSAVRNLISWANADGTLSHQAADASSRARYGWANEIRTDVTLSSSAELAEIVDARLDALAWPVAAVEALQIPIYDDGSAELSAALVGDAVLLYYGGADRFTRLEIVAQVSHRIDAERWDVTLSLFDVATIAGPVAVWGEAAWNMNVWGPAEGRRVEVG
jgi:hypothetical protein